MRPRLCWVCSCGMRPRKSCWPTRACGPLLRPCCLTLVCGHRPGSGQGAAQPDSTDPLTTLCPPPERHFQRLSRTLQAATFLDFLWHNMKLPTLPAAPPVPPSTL